MVVLAVVRVITADLVPIVRRWAALAAVRPVALAAEAAALAADRAAASAAVLPAAAAVEDRFNARKTGYNIFAEFFVFSG